MPESNNLAPKPAFMSAKQAAEWLGLKPNTLRKCGSTAPDRPTENTASVSFMHSKICSNGPTPVAVHQPLNSPMFEAKRMKRNAIFYALSTFVGTSLLALSSLELASTKLVWNASQSVPSGLYRITNETPAKDDLVLARLPNWVTFLANQRGYLPRNTPVLKHLSALKGDVVCRVSDRIYINQTFTAIALKTDQKSRKMPRWQGCKRLQQGEVFLLADHQYSFDGRYFGITKISSIIGKAKPLWRIAD